VQSYRSCITFFLPGHFSGLTAPQAFPRLDRRMLTPTRAGHVKAGRSSRPPKAWPLHDRARRHAGSIGACSLPLSTSPLARTFDSVGCIVLFAVEGLAAPWPSRVSTPQCPNAFTGVSREESRGRRGPSRRGQWFAAIFRQMQAQSGPSGTFFLLLGRLRRELINDGQMPAGRSPASLGLDDNFGSARKTTTLQRFRPELGGQPTLSGPGREDRP